MRDLSTTVVAVTGASRGIGAAVARRLGAAGARVYICGRDKQALDEVARGGDGLHPMVVDIRNEQAVQDWMDAIEDREGGLDILINNAGILGPRATLVETDAAAWRETLEINATGTFLVTRAAFPLLQDSAEPLVINLSSSVGRVGRGRWGAYSVSKFAVEGIAEVAADELADHGGCVVTLNPGGTATDMRAEAYPDEDPSTLPSADEIAATVEVLVRGLTAAQNKAKYSSRELFDLVGQAVVGEEIPQD